MLLFYNISLPQRQLLNLSIALKDNQLDLLLENGTEFALSSLQIHAWDLLQA